MRRQKIWTLETCHYKMTEILKLQLLRVFCVVPFVYCFLSMWRPQISFPWKAAQVMGVGWKQKVGLDGGCFGVVLHVRCFRGLLEGSGAERCGRQWQSDSWRPGVPNWDQRAHLTVTEYAIALIILSYTLMCILYINTQNHTMSRSKPLSGSLTVSLTNGLQATITRLAPY